MSESNLNPPPSRPAGGPSRGPSAGFLFGIVIVAVAIAGWGIFGRIQARAAMRDEADAAAVPTVMVVPVKKSSGADALVLPGTVEAFADASIYARTNGYLKRWMVDIGARVKAGDMLAEIDTPEIDQQLRQAEADLKTAQANETLAKSTAERWKALLETQAVSQQDTDQKLGDYAAKKALTESAMANLQRLRDTQGFQRVVAPFAGTVTARHTDVGQLVSSTGGAELFHMADTRHLRVYVQVPQAYAPAAKPGLEADLVFSERPGKLYHAAVSAISDSLDTTTRTRQVQLALDNASGELYPGAYVEVHFKLALAGESLRVPANALMFGVDGLRVAAVDASNHVVLKPIVAGRDFGTELEVMSGLESDDRLIVNPPDSLQSGAMVHIAAPAKAAG